MSVPYCSICQDQDDQALAEGDYCPVCYKPTCRTHLLIVRFKWRDNGHLDSTLVCKNCKTRYLHRYWDTARRDWIS